MKRIPLWCFLACLQAAPAAQGLCAQDSGQQLFSNAAFTLRAERHGIGELFRTGDVHPTNYIRAGKLFGELTVRYTHQRRLDSVSAAEGGTTVSQPGQAPAKWKPVAASVKPLHLSQSFSLDGGSLTWKIRLQNTSAHPLRVEDFVLPFFYNAGGGENPFEIFEQRVVKHHFISGHNSFIFWQRPTGLGPYLVLTPLPGTSLEYFATGRDRAFQAYVHSALTGNKELRGSWRQPHTSLALAPGADTTYGFTFRWARDYNGVRDILAAEGLIDVQVMPGMSLPRDLEATIALRTRHRIDAVRAEFSPDTRITYAGKNQQGAHLYKLKFSRLGENQLTIRYGGQYRTTLEFFITEPLETLFKKRASFIVNRLQFKDTAQWYDGLFGPYDMKNAALRGPDNADYFDTSRLSYLLTCDDPGLCKAPFVAAKNVVYPDAREIAALEYYAEHFVWGGLQRTDKEQPYPYGVYGTPNWLVNRDTAARKRNTNDPNREKMHVWRSYDYPHILMLYFHLYQVASLYPGSTHYLDRKGYLERARETAKAYFRYPYEILPWYETYKWGCYNELLIVDLVEELKKEGFSEDAAWLTAEWEKKVKYFLYDDPYPFRSEYAIDATAFESSHALARYALGHRLQPDSNLWFDKNLNRWYSHPVVRPEDAERFMERQLQANLALRGVLEPAYYFLGSDFRGRSDQYTLSYMSQMGGWAILDYALHFSKAPADYIRLGYQSYLSSFALINSGTAQTNYGYWYPGIENDGAAGWAFEPQKFAHTWIQKPQGRGPWFYDGEIDLGFGGATRMAATVVTLDPVFGLVAYGGDLRQQGNTLAVTPRDGLRRRLYYRNGPAQFDLELDRDGLARDRELLFTPSEGKLQFTLENRTSDAHTVHLSLRGLSGAFTLLVNGKPVRPLRLNGEQTVVPVALDKRPLANIVFRKH
ncbi:DUF5695 domain-containing protein [Paraflavisolibacter sp. H34]|uniref:DUF5695 domain-containing protein n=1 Tax=Huijunlia imazamoxiresistens TaxID=3127457 RepID=UPI003018A938